MARPKEQLGEIIRKTGEIFKVSDVAAALGISNQESAKKLARWTNQGWLARIKRGLYAAVPIDATTTERALEDSWVLVPELFSPCYIGGWSAAEYWDFTEQIFRDICVITERHIPQKKLELHNISFMITRIKNALGFGTKQIWRLDKKVLISDPHRTIIDMLYDPELGGGIQHVTECFAEYIKSSHFNVDILSSYTEKLNNGAVYKRLGFLCERTLGQDHQLTKLCKMHLTKGNSYLDPKQKDGALITRWKLFVPLKFKDIK
jgi:predicted transcriptional regulator of viral defense system